MAGISPDKPEVNARFREDMGLDAILLSDPDRKIRRAYQSMRVFGGFRTTYLIDEQGIIRSANEYIVVGIGRHVNKIVEELVSMREDESKG